MTTTNKVLLIFVCLPLAGFAGATDYNFGGDTTGATGYQCADSSVWVTPATSPANEGNLDSVVIWLDANYNTNHVAVVIYKADSTIWDSTVYWNVTTDSKTRYRADFINGAAIAASTAYLVGIHLTLASGDAEDGPIKYDEKGSGTTVVWRQMAAQATIPAAFTTSGTASVYAAAIILYYSSAAPAATSQVIIIGQYETAGKSCKGESKLEEISPSLNSFSPQTEHSVFGVCR